MLVPWFWIHMNFFWGWKSFCLVFVFSETTRFYVQYFCLNSRAENGVKCQMNEEGYVNAILYNLRWRACCLKSAQVIFANKYITIQNRTPDITTALFSLRIQLKGTLWLQSLKINSNLTRILRNVKGTCALLTWYC